VTTSFFEQVYEVVRRIPRGQVATYGQVARLLGTPRAARTVGWALHSIPKGNDVPWHRVLNARGGISLGARGQAAALQQSLLEDEGIVFDDSGRIDLDKYGWPGLSPTERYRLLERGP
jgi:methylated-DNA-protein-cysteine methyltransferase-like protein